MKSIVKQVVGIDVAQHELVVSLGRILDDWSAEVCASKTVANTQRGFDQLIDWVKKLTHPGIPVRFVMEATGVYHERLAYYLDDRKLELSIVLPNKISNYFRSLEVKTVTDKTASEAITRFGLERNLDQWKRPKKVYKSLKQLTRERDQLIQERTMLLNFIHADQAEVDSDQDSIDRIEQRIALINKQEKEVKAAISKLIKGDKEVARSVKLLMSIPGVGELTAAITLAETNGFELIRNKRQLVSYAGLDVKEKQSGTSVKGKPKISKRGNKHLRKAMHLPALTAIRYNEKMKSKYAHLVGKHGIKMKAAVAIQRKLLELIFTIFKKQTPFEKDYQQNQQKNQLTINN
jgi:transposase